MQIPGLELALDPDRLDWSSTRSPGISLVLLHPGPAELERARAEHGTAVEGAVLIRMDPGHGYPAHRHLGVEEVLVLSGGYRDEQGVYEAGTYVRYEPGSQHTPVALGDRALPHGRENPACVLFATARAGIELIR